MASNYRQLIDEMRAKCLSNHCFVLVLMLFLTNFMKNNYSLTSILGFNYVFVYILNHKTNHLIICLTISSTIFTLFSNYLLISDSMLLLFLLSFLSNYCFVYVLNQMKTQLNSSFSLGEMFIVSQLSVSYLSTSVSCVVSHLFNSNGIQLFCAKNTSSLVIQILFIGIALIFWIEILIINLGPKRGKMLDITLISMIISVTYFLLYFCIKTEPIVWLNDFVFNDRNRINLLVIWATIMSFVMVFAIYYSNKGHSKWTTIIRKIFHILISIIYLFGIQMDLNFLSFSSSAVFVIFMFIEVIRIRKIPPFGQQIEIVFDKFRDEKDRGLLTLTHIYLLVGCSLPIWLTYSYSPLLLASGVITVGFGDSAASIAGTLFGRHHWKGSKKTFEGTLAAVITQIIVCLFIIQYFSVNILINCYLMTKIIIISLITPIIESNIREIDNLLLPLYHLLFVLLLF